MDGRVPTKCLEDHSRLVSPLPIGSMYDIFTYIWLIFMVNVSKSTLHGSFGLSRVGLVIYGLSVAYKWRGYEPLSNWDDPSSGPKKSVVSCK